MSSAATGLLLSAVVGGKSQVMGRLRRRSVGVFEQDFSHAWWTSRLKKRSSSGQRAKEGTRRRRCRLERREGMV